MPLTRCSPLAFALAPLFALFAVGACTASSPDAIDADVARESEAARAAAYVDIETVLTPAQTASWSTIRAGLVDDFDRICGDTFCGGDRSDLTSVRLRCSESVKTHEIKACTWVFGGSITGLDHAKGKLTGAPHAFVCKIPISATRDELLADLAPAGSPTRLQRALPHSTTSIYDALGGCLSGVVVPKSGLEHGTGGYDHLNDSPATDIDRLNTLRWRINDAFASRCTDTFCAGDYTDFAPLSFDCGATSTGVLGGCTWSFVGASLSVAKTTGSVTAKTEAKACQVVVHGTIGALLDALSTDPKVDVLHQKLPGTNASLFDAIAPCL